MDLAGRVLYRDGLVLVIDKPAGVPVHAGPGGGPNLEQGFDSLRFGWKRPPALAHRLDRETSGCLVLGRHPKALRRLGRLFASGRVGKTYWAWTAGAPPEEAGLIEAPLLKRSTRAGGWSMQVDGEGKQAGRHPLPRAGAPGRRDGPDRMPAADGPHAPDPGASGSSRLPGGGRCALWRPAGAAHVAARPRHIPAAP